jgi:hypothetical protein
MRFFKKYTGPRKKYRLGSKRLSTFWLKYLLQHLSAVQKSQQISQLDSTDLHDFCNFLYKEFYKNYKGFFVYHVKSFSFLYMAFKVNAAFGSNKSGRGIFKSRFRVIRANKNNNWQRKLITPRVVITRHTLDKHPEVKLMSRITFGEYRELKGKSNFWLRDRDQRKQLQLIWKKYRYHPMWKPFSYTKKKYKLYFYWSDYALFKRFPTYRRKYPIQYDYPFFADYRRLFINQIKSQQYFRWVFRLKYQQLVNKFKKSAHYTKYTFERAFLNFFELRMDVVVYRLNFAFSIKQAKQWINRSFFQVNQKTINWYSYHINVGDLITPTPVLRQYQLRKRYWFFEMGRVYRNVRLFYRPIQADQYPEHFMLNERVPAALMINQPNPYQVRFHRPISIQFLTLSFNCYS